MPEPAGSMRNYEVEIEGWGHRSTLRVTARSRSAAKYAAWFEVSEPTQISFARFLREWVRSVRLTDKATRYTYSAEFYGVDVVVGQRVAIRGGGFGVVCEPPGCNDRSHHVYVSCNGKAGQPYHPMSLRPIQEAP